MPAAALSRRRFLGRSTAAAVALAAPSACGAQDQAARGRAIIVGAGIAGAVAAFELEQRGWRVTVLEARSRAGGRTLTLRSPFAGRQLGEAGGEYIDTGHTTMRSYARRLGLRLDDLRRTRDDDLSGVVFRRGRRRTEEAVVTRSLLAEADRFYERVESLATPLDAADPAARGADRDRRSVAELLDELELEGLPRLLVERDVRDEFTVEPAELSLLHLLQTVKAGEDQSEAGVEVFRIRGGNDQVASGLLDELRGRVELGAPVTRIEQDDAGVAVTVRDERFEADRCVVATPLPPLREVEFAPALPDAHAQAVAELQYGRGTKTLLQYDERFWVEAGFSGDTATDLPISTTWESTDAQRGERGILLCYTVGEPGERLGRLSDRARTAACARDVRRVYPESRGLLGSSATIAWHRERFTGGTYTAYAPGQVERFFTAVRRPHGRIHFAGEHTDVLNGYMEGAARSGRRAAAEVDRAEA